MFELPLMHGSFIVCCLKESAQIMYIRFFSFCEERYAHALFVPIKESEFPFSRKHSGKEVSVKCCSFVKICAQWVSNYSGKVPMGSPSRKMWDPRPYSADISHLLSNVGSGCK